MFEFIFYVRQRIIRPLLSRAEFPCQIFKIPTINLLSNKHATWSKNPE